jgi:glycogen synthase
MEGIIYGLLPRLKGQNSRILLHGNDWMTGLLPAAAAAQGIASLFTVHNIFTAKQSPHGLLEHGIDVRPFEHGLYYERHPDSFPNRDEHYLHNRVDFLTSGLFAAERINTVSPTFLEEIVRRDFSDIGLIPESMWNVIKERYQQGRASGILNAPMLLSDPRVDPFLHRNYGWVDLREGKDANKREFQAKWASIPRSTAHLLLAPPPRLAPEGRRTDAGRRLPHDPRPVAPCRSPSSPTARTSSSRPAPERCTPTPGDSPTAPSPAN